MLRDAGTAIRHKSRILGKTHKRNYRIMKIDLKYTLLIILSAIMFAQGYLLNTSKTDLEIYTNENIYYVNGLTVTNEGNAERLVFENKEQLKEYISHMTVEDNR